MSNPSEVLAQYHDFDAMDGLPDMINLRNRIDDATALLAKYKAELDEELIRRMKEQKRASFTMQLASGKSIITYKPKKKETITDAPRLEKMLFEGSKDERELAKKAIPMSPSSWKVAQVRVLCDSLGINQKELILKTFQDEIKLSLIPVEMLERQGKM